MKKLALILLIILTSCGAKKKTVDRGSEKSIELSSKSFHRLTADTSVTTSNINRVYVADYKRKGFKMTFRPSNPNKPVKYTDNTGRSFSVTGASEFTVEDYEVESKLTDSLKSESTENKGSSESVVFDENKNVEESKSWRNTVSKVLRIPTWLWVFLFLVVLLCLAYRYFR